MENEEGFSDKYKIEFKEYGSAPDDTWEGQIDQAKSMFKTVFKVMSENQVMSIIYLVD